MNVESEGIKKGDTIGTFEVLDDGQVISKIDIVAGEETEELSWFGKLLRIISFGLV